MAEAGKPTAERPRTAVVLGGSLFLLAALAAVLVSLSGRWDAWSAMAGTANVGWRLDPLRLTAAVACEILAFLAGAALWTSVFRATGASIGVREGVFVWIGTQLGRYLPGKIWQATGLVGYMRTRGDSATAAITVGIALQAATLATGAGLAAATLGAAALVGIGPWTAVAGVLILSLALTPSFLRGLMRLGSRLLREGDASRPPRFGWRMLVGIAAGRLALWVPQGLGFWLLAEGLLASNPLDPWSAIGVFAAAYVAGVVVILAPAGMVVREAALAALLGAAAGIPVAAAAALALAARLWTTASEMAAFGIAALLALAARRAQV